METKIENLFQFIDFLESKKSEFEDKEQLFNELSELYRQESKIDKSKFGWKLEFDKIQKSIDEIRKQINPLYSEILDKLLYLNLIKEERYGIYNFLWNIGSADRFKENATKEQATKTMFYLRKYIDFRKKTKDKFKSFPLSYIFSNFDKILKSLYDFFNKTDKNEFEEFMIFPIQIISQQISQPKTNNDNEANTDNPQQLELIKGYFKFNRQNENYIIDYLTEIKTLFDFKVKLTFGGVCLALFEKNLHKKEIKTFTKFMGILADYWKVELPKDKRKNKYEAEKKSLSRFLCKQSLPCILSFINYSPKIVKN